MARSSSFQIDNEGSFYFREGAYSQDYHPDALRAYRDFLRAKYGTIDALSLAYGLSHQEGEDPPSDLTRFTSIEPPRRFDAEIATDLVRHLDWCAFQEQLLTTAMSQVCPGAARRRFVRTTHRTQPSAGPRRHATASRSYCRSRRFPGPRLLPRGRTNRARRHCSCHDRPCRTC